MWSVSFTPCKYDDINFVIRIDYHKIIIKDHGDFKSLFTDLVKYRGQLNLRYGSCRKEDPRIKNKKGRYWYYQDNDRTELDDAEIIFKLLDDMCRNELLRVPTLIVCNPDATNKISSRKPLWNITQDEYKFDIIIGDISISSAITEFNKQELVKWYGVLQCDEGYISHNSHDTYSYHGDTIIPLDARANIVFRLLCRLNQPTTIICYT
jgi:hypothetical protein